MVSRVTSFIFRVFLSLSRTKPSNHPSGGPCHSSFRLLFFFATRNNPSISTRLVRWSKESSHMSVSEGATVDISNTISDTVGSLLKALHGWLPVCINIELDEQ